MEEVTQHNVPKETGWIEVITGCMFSGKTEELIRRLRRAQIAKQTVVIFKPQIDKRYSSNHIVSHNTQQLPSQMLETADQIIPLAKDARVIGIDEVQFFGSPVIGICEQLANEGKRVIVAGLDQDFRGKPFGPMPDLLALGEYITKTLAICVKCGNPADRTQRTSKESELVVVGAQDHYEARCRRCYEPPAQA